MQNGKMHGGASKLLFKRAHELRHSLTHAEVLLWHFLKTKAFGYKFRRQHPFSIYILDFYCHALKLVIEVDGGIHNEAGIKDNDQIRQQYFGKEGLLVVRFTNDEVIHAMETIISKLEIIVHNRINAK